MFRKDYFVGPENLAGARAAIWEECRWHFRDWCECSGKIKAMLDLMAKQRGNEAERGPSVLVVLLAIGSLALLVLCLVWFLFFGP